MFRFFSWCKRLVRDARRAVRHPLFVRLALSLAFFGLLEAGIWFCCEAQWQAALGFGEVYRTRILTQGLLFCGTAFSVLGLAAWPLRVFASLPPARLELSPRYAWIEKRLAALSRFDARSLQLLILFLAVLSARDAANRWPQALLFNGADWGVNIAPWRLDAALWTFRLPGLHLMLDTALRAVDIALLAALPPALGRGAAQFLTRRPILPPRALHCLAVLGALWFACHAAYFFVAPFDLALAPGGLDFLDWQARRHVLWLSGVLSALAALALLAACIFRVRAAPIVQTGVAALVLPPLLLALVPRLVALGAWDEARREAPFRRAARLATQSAWNLDEMALHSANIVANPVVAERAARGWNAEALARLPLWDGARLRKLAPCSGAALQTDRLSDPAKLIGSGVCEDAPGAVHFDVASARPLSTGLREDTLANYGLASARLGPGEVGEIELHSALTRVLWAWRLRDARIVAARGKRLLFRANMSERARAVTPFLVPGGAPCAVVSQGRIFWMLDLLCVSDKFPGSRGQILGGRTFNAARDSVKMVMDSATGETHFYASHAVADPLLRAWQSVFPALVRPLSAMPRELRVHRRYPVELLKIQAPLAGFVVGSQPAKNWQLARQVNAAGVYETQTPFFLLDERGFALNAVLSGTDLGDTTAAILTARCDGDEYGRLSLYRFDAATAPLDSGLVGPGAFDLRVRDALPAAPDGKASHWKPGAVRTLWRGGRVWLWQAIFREESKSPPRLAAVVVGDAAWPNEPLGVGSNAQKALEDWRRALRGQITQSAPETANERSFARRLRAVLEPQAAQDAAKIAELIAEAARLQDAAQIAEKTDAAAATQLRRREREILETLRRVTGENAVDVEVLPSEKTPTPVPTPKDKMPQAQVPATKAIKTTP